MKLSFNVVTCCIRYAYLSQILQSFIASRGELPVALNWIIVIDVLHIAPHFLEDAGFLQNLQRQVQQYPDFSLTIIHHEDIKDPANAAFAAIDDGLVCLIDDDNIMHPDYIKTIYAYAKDNPVMGFLYHQIMENDCGNEKIRLVTSTNIRPGVVDTAQITIHRKLIGKTRWPDLRHYTGPTTPDGMRITPDGRFITKMYERWKSKFVIIPQVLCYYNYSTSDKLT